MAGLGVAKIYQASSAGGGMLSANAGNVLGSIVISMIMSVVVMLGAVIAIWLAVGMLIVRILVLSFLIILAPAAFLCRVLPNAQDLWAKWWKTFINYCLFAPAFAFFLYLALLTAQKSTESVGITSNAPYAGLPQAGNSFFSAGDTLIHYVLFLGLILGGLMMAKHFGIAGGAKVYAWGTGAMKKVSGYNFAQRKGMETWGAIKEKAKTGASRRFGKALDSGRLKKLQAVPVVGRFAKRAQINALAKEREGNDKIKASFAKYLPEELKKLMPQLSKREQAVAMQHLAEKGELSVDEKAGFTQDKIKGYAKSMPKFQANYMKVLKAMPDLATEIPEFMEKVRDKEKDLIEKLQEDFDDFGVTDFKNQYGSTSPEAVAAIDRVLQKMKPSDASMMSSKSIEESELLQKRIAEALHDPSKRFNQSFLSNIAYSDNIDLHLAMQEKIIEPNRAKNNFAFFKKPVRDWLSSTVAQAMSAAGQARQQPTTTPPSTPPPSPPPSAPAGGGGGPP